MLYRALKIAAGKHCFRPGDQLDLPDDEAKLLLADEAIEPIEGSEKSQPKKKSGKTSKG